MAMSSSERFDIATGVLSVLVLFFALLERVLPRTRLIALEKCFKHADADLDALWEEGFLGGDSTQLIERLDCLRQQSDRLAARVHAASSVYLQIIEIFKGLSCSLSALHRRVLGVQAEITSRKSAIHALEKEDEPMRAIPASLSVSRSRDEKQSRSRSRRSSVSTSGRPHLSRSHNKVVVVSPALTARSSTAASSFSTATGRVYADQQHSQAKLSDSYRSKSAPKLAGGAKQTPLPRIKSSHMPSSDMIGIIEEDSQPKAGHSGSTNSTRGRGTTKRGMFYVPS